jgi:hypothetical protein
VCSLGVRSFARSRSPSLLETPCRLRYSAHAQACVLIVRSLSLLVLDRCSTTGRSCARHPRARCPRRSAATELRKAARRCGGALGRYSDGRCLLFVCLCNSGRWGRRHRGSPACLCSLVPADLGGRSLRHCDVQTGGSRSGSAIGAGVRMLRRFVIIFRCLFHVQGAFLLLLWLRGSMCIHAG